MFVQNIKKSPKRVMGYAVPPAEMVDYSFLKLMAVSDLVHEMPRNKKDKMPDGKYRATIIKLNNNFLISINNFMDSLGNILTRPEVLTWIDLSFNSLDKIDPVLSEFPRLQILLLHGNKIAEPHEVLRLVPCKVLKKLALHGNPIESVKNYRPFVISVLPNLKSFDMSPVTRMDLNVSRTLFHAPRIRIAREKDPPKG